MTPERWEHIGKLYAAASALPAADRAGFLRDACGDDRALCEEVESLLTSDAGAGEFLRAGALSDAARMLAEDDAEPLTGRNLSQYEIGALIGSGGMGEVYRAHDPRLRRDVAIKVLSSLDNQSDSARRRFRREAQAVAALSHPNVRSLYDVDEADGRVYAVMELLDGETLRARLSRGPLPWRKATELAAAIADGLAAAHAKRIVHRDLKPENIFITASGQAKVLDFGLAKMQAPVDAHGTAETIPGVILGTAGYMSPEQVSGKEVDARSDIFSLGCVLYEMISGRRVFDRRTSAETMTAILNDEPPELEAVNGDLRRLVSHCLEKQPDARFQSAQDLAFQLRGLLNSAHAGGTVRAPSDRRLWALLGGLVVIIIIGVVMSIVPLRQDPPTRQVRFDLPAPANTTFSTGAFALSPDGSRLAFVTSSDETPARRRLWIHSFESAELQPLAGAGDVENAPPVWSPDGRYLAFAAEGRIRKILVSGGSPQTVVEAAMGETFQVPMGWSAEDIILFQRSHVVMKVSAAGGETTALTALDRGRREMTHYSPRFLPDGQHFLYGRLSLEEGLTGIFVGSVDAKPEQQNSRRLISTRGSARYARSKDDPRVGHLLFNREGTLLAQGFDAGRLELVGEPVPVAEQVGEADTPARSGFFSVSETGALAYRRQEAVAGVPVWVEPGGRETTPLLDAPLARPEQLRLSPDGRRLAVIVSGDVWVYDLGGRPPVKLTSGAGNDMLLWRPDGKRIVYARTRPPFRLLSVPADVAGAQPERVSPEGHFHPHGWSANGRDLIAVLNTYSAMGWDILEIPMDEKLGPKTILRTPSDEGVAGAALSPDGRWLAYSSNATGEREIWVQPYPGPGASIRMSPRGGADPVWARDGQKLYYLENRRLMAVEIESGQAFNFKPPAFVCEIPEPALRFPNQSYDVAPDGRVITIKAAAPGSAPPISVILNWNAALTK